MTQPAKVARWIETFANAAPFTVETRVVQSKTLGPNRVPARLRLEHFEDLIGALGVADQVAEAERALGVTERRIPELVTWVMNHPREVLAVASVWERLLDVVIWVLDIAPATYLRDADIPGIDTKFIETHQRVLTRLLVEVLPPDRVGPPGAGFARRFGFLAKPAFTRLRPMDSVSCLPSQLTDMQVRTDELALVDIDVSTVYVVENEVSYLRFPPVDDAVVIFGNGFAVTTLEALPWVAKSRLIYWGDIDTHGFAILDQLRQRFSHTESLLMDERTLRSHLDLLVVEDQPTARPLAYLTPLERDVYEGLIDGRFGAHARLEQERIRFSTVRDAIDALATSPQSGQSEDKVARDDVGTSL